jgi:formate C-acetyltransferase
MNQRVKTLRDQSVNTKPYISSQRAELLTEFYKSGIPDQVSIPVARGLALKYIMERKTIAIGDGELIVGERGPAPKATPTYPELCCHTLEDFEVMGRRQRTPFEVDEHVRKVYQETIIPFWKGKTIRDKVFGAMTERWMSAFHAGVFTEFMEQRAPGHTVLDNKIYTRGLLDLQDDIRQELRNLDFLNDMQAYDKQQQLIGFGHAIDAIIIQAQRYSQLAQDLAAKEKDSKRQKELLRISAACKHVPAYAPRSFYEALQMYWFIHLGVVTELNGWDSYSPGRLDQHLYPFYKRELEAGTLDEEKAKEYLGCFWVKFNNQPAPPKVGITEAQSGTYTDFALINIGGVNPEDGSDAVNDVSYLMLDVVEDMKLVQPSACIQISAKNPDRFLRRACQVVRCGFGQPSIFNTDVIIREMLLDGKTMFDARTGGASGCVETSAFGKESCILTGYINWPKIFELALHNGIDPLTGKQIGLKTGNAAQFGSFEDVVNAYKKQLQYFIDIKVEGNNVIERLYANYMPAMTLSVLTNDCIKKGRNYHDGGTRYNTSYIQGVGLGTLTDALAAIKYHIYDHQTLPMEQLLSAMKNNFAQDAALQAKLKQSPRFGNDDEYADDLAKEVFNIYFDVLNGRPNTRGGKYRINLLPTTVHIYFGQMTGALPNGRPAGVPVSDGISPSHGADDHGPTAVIKSAAKIDHARTGGTLLNMKFAPQTLDNDGLEKLLHLVRSYFRLDGHHIQFNVVTAQMLREAQKNPAEYKNLIVRVAGYSDYFNDIGPDLQNEIIARTEQQGF